MSWSGPVAGAAPYQPQPYPNGQPAYGQRPQYPYGQQPPYAQYPAAPTYPPAGQPQRPQENRQPPKKKGNPIITRYPLPPGYQAPKQPQGPFGGNQYPNQYQAPQPGFPQAAAQVGYQQVPPQPGFPQAAPPAGYPQAPVPPAYPQGYAAPAPAQAYPPQAYAPPQPPYQQQPQQQQWPQAQNYQWPQQPYPPNQGFQQAQVQPGAQGYAPVPSTYQGYPPQPAAIDPNQQAYAQAPGWPQPNGQAQLQHNQYNAYNGLPHGLPQAAQNALDPNATPTPAPAHLITAQATEVASQPASATEESKATDKPQLFLGWDDWDFEFEGAIWPKSNEPVDPDLSLGVIVWHPAKQMNRALASTFDEAEADLLKPPPQKLDNGDSVSLYFTAENSHEAFLDVRQTDGWESIRDDPIFITFTDEDLHRNLISLEDCVAQRDRPDVYLGDVKQDVDEEMPDAQWNVMDHLEKVLASVNGAPEPKTVEHEMHSPPQPSQDDILASLGVTGLAKPPSNEVINIPSPESDAKPSVPRFEPSVAASAPHHSHALPQRASSSFAAPNRGGRGGHFNHNTAPQRYGPMSASGHHKPPPPPPPPEPRHYDPWNQPPHNGNGNGHPGFGGSPAPSDGSNHTMVGSDFEPEEPVRNNDADAVKLEGNDNSYSRKRSYEDAGDDKPRYHDDHTKRKRRMQVDAAYSRR